MWSVDFSSEGGIGTLVASFNTRALIFWLKNNFLPHAYTVVLPADIPPTPVIAPARAAVDKKIQAM